MKAPVTKLYCPKNKRIKDLLWLMVPACMVAGFILVIFLK